MFEAVCLSLVIVLNVSVGDKQVRRVFTHVSGCQPQVEGAAVFLTALNRQDSNCRQPLAHHQPAQHAHALKHTRQGTLGTAAVMSADLW